MRNFTAIFADLTPEEIAEIMANPKCRLGSHADLAAERDAMAEEIERLRELLAESYADADDVLRPYIRRLEEQLAESQAREARLRDALTRISTNTIHWYASIQNAKEALAMHTDDTALKEAIKQAKRKALLEAADWLGTDDNDVELMTAADEIKSMAEALK